MAWNVASLTTRHPRAFARSRLATRSVATPAEPAASTASGGGGDGGGDGGAALVDTTISKWLAGKVSEALVEAFGEEYGEKDPMITPATKAGFGDYQVPYNGV